MGLRKTMVVDRKFQYSFIVKNVLLLFFTFALMFAVLKVWEHEQVKQGFLLRPPSNSTVVAWAQANNVEIGSADFFQAFLSQAKVYTFFELLWKPMVIVLVINIIVLVIANLYYSHKIAGPLHRLKNELERKLNGEAIKPITFRKGDPFQELADVINRVLAQQNNNLSK